MILRCFAVLAISNLLLPAAARAQSIEPAAVNASGDFFSNTTHSFEYNVGQLIPSGVQAPHTPGVHQPAWYVGLEEASVAGARVQVFPNPMETLIYLQPDWNAGETMHYILFDALGKMILQRSVRLINGNERQEIDVAVFAAGSYILEVSTGQSASKTRFKLQKLR